MSPDTGWSVLDQPSPVLVWSILGAVLLLLVGASAARVVGPDQRAAVIRLARVCRVRGPGLVLSVPGLEQVRLVSLAPTSISAPVTGSTREGVHASVTINALYQVDDPVAVVEVCPNPGSWLIEDLERTLHHQLAATTLPHLLLDREVLAARMQVGSNRRAAFCGVRVLDVEVTTIEVELNPGVLRWVR